MIEKDRRALRMAADEIALVLGPSLHRLAADSEPKVSAARIGVIADYAERLFRFHHVSRDGAGVLAGRIRSALERGPSGSIGAVLAGEEDGSP